MKEHKIGRGINLVVIDSNWPTCFIILHFSYVYKFRYTLITSSNKIEDTMEAKAVENFDTFSDGLSLLRIKTYFVLPNWPLKLNWCFMWKDAALLRFLKEKTIDEDIVIMASYDEMSNGYFSFHISFFLIFLNNCCNLVFLSMRESSVKLLASFGS